MNDKIVSINGQLTVELTKADALRLIKESPDKVVLEITRGRYRQAPTAAHLVHKASENFSILHLLWLGYCIFDTVLTN